MNKHYIAKIEDKTIVWMNEHVLDIEKKNNTKLEILEEFKAKGIREASQYYKEWIRNRR